MTRSQDIRWDQIAAIGPIKPQDEKSTEKLFTRLRCEQSRVSTEYDVIVCIG